MRQMLEERQREKVDQLEKESAEKEKTEQEQAGDSVQFDMFAENAPVEVFFFISANQNR